jgi:hypothetical protein
VPSPPTNSSSMIVAASISSSIDLLT